MLSLPAKPRFSCKWLGTILKLSADQLLVSNWSQAQVQNFSFSKKLYLVVFNRIAMFILVQWTQPCMNFYVRILKITSGVFNLNRPYKKHLIKVARYSFSRSIPPMFECKLRRRKQRFGKIDTTVVLDKDENLLWSGCNDIGVVIATKWRHYLFYLQHDFSALGTVLPKSFTGAFSNNNRLDVREV